MGSCEIVEEKDEVRLAKHYGKSVLGSSSKDLEGKQRDMTLISFFNLYL
ncbi:BnaC06g14200D [Brassica napus]|uniref:BnaC06g14200D protein n=1 Tax=Brassica napus TaxID=3708 RepID=A0A078FK03_BRANA|nr:BnaC06g14200D [Brassica napus]